MDGMDAKSLCPGKDMAKVPIILHVGLPKIDKGLHPI